MQFEIISDTMDYKAIDLLSDFGGYLGLFIGASILYLYDISINFLRSIITKFKSRIGTSTRIEELKTEYDGGQDKEMKTNDKTFQLTQNTTSTPIRISYSENENSKILIKIQEELAKQADMLAKLDNKFSMGHYNVYKNIRK